ncbi:MAG TPA: 30S ribosomal protein S17 [Candidatus Aenigmarchaeota archaeon]|nr:MAG: 30S ribosomal protein S17 [Candidatus Aenigmarchaeota archaeon]HDD45882.1 30S ribosomal protein S17 [Candidatus Aenigmarchaeota archaeon]
MKDNIGIDVPKPKKKCNDINCAWHGRLPIRGRIFKGIVRSTKAKKTVVVEWEYNRYVHKYERYERCKSRVSAHNPDCMHAREGDRVIIGECRPLSKTKHFVVIAVERNEGNVVKHE